MELDEAMGLAIAEARLAEGHGDVPVGAVVLSGEELVSTAHNERELRNDPTAHAEVLALSAAAAKLGRASLAGCTLVVSLEPCFMCAGALRAAGVDRVVFATYDEKAGACGSRYNLCADIRLGPDVPVVAGLRADEAAGLLTGFFAAQRGPA